MKEINIGMKVRIICDDLMFCIGDGDFIVKDTKDMLGEKMIKVEGNRLWFNSKDFEVVKNE